MYKRVFFKGTFMDKTLELKINLLKVTVLLLKILPNKLNLYFYYWLMLIFNQNKASKALNKLEIIYSI